MLPLLLQEAADAKQKGFPSETLTKTPISSYTLSHELYSPDFMKPFHVLMLGRRQDAAWALPQILYEAGLTVDLISSEKLLLRSSFIRNKAHVPLNTSLVPTVQDYLNQHVYQWAIITDDETLIEIAHSNLSKETKLFLLPIYAESAYSHLYSKIGLATALVNSKILTPPFLIAHSLNEALFSAESLSFPVYVKIDASSGGMGCFECHNQEEVRNLPIKLFKENLTAKKTMSPYPKNYWERTPDERKKFEYAKEGLTLETPILIQKKILGKLIDCSALFLNKKLLYFTHSELLETHLNKHGPSILRKFSTPNQIDPNIQIELSLLGETLNINGFTNISCIEAIDGSGRYYFEADLRPNGWLYHGKYAGFDLPLTLSSTLNTCLRSSSTATRPLDSTLLIPHFLRVPYHHFLTNKHHVWRFTPSDYRFFIIKKMLMHYLKSLLRRIVRLKSLKQ